MSLFCRTQRKIFWRMWKQSRSGAILTYVVYLLWKSMVPKRSWLQTFFKNIFLCVRQNKRNSYRFGTTWGWVNDERIFIFGWTLKYIENVSIHYFSNQKELPTANEAWPVQSIATELGECLWPIFNYRLPDKPLTTKTCGTSGLY